MTWSNLTFLNDQWAYDGVKRLTSATDTNYTRTFGYDVYGNMSVSTNSGVTLNALTPQNNNGTSNPFNSSTNRIASLNGASVGYEARGMMTTLGGLTMGFDAEGNMTSANDSAQGLTWIYDAEGQRVEKWIASGPTTLFIHDAFGNLASQYDNVGAAAACVTCYLSYDMLGTPRMITDQNQNVVARHDYLPYGEEVANEAGRTSGLNTPQFGVSANVTQGFTGQEADGGIATLDFFNARHLAGVLGAFVQPDPLSAGGDFLNPQSWNGYGYVLGNPLGYTDPSGLCSRSDSTPCYADTGYGNPDFATTAQPAPSGFFEFWISAFNFLLQPGGGGGGSTGSAPPSGPTMKITPPPAKNGKCGAPIMQPTYTSIFGRVGKDLSINPLFVMSTALQESGWNLVHVFGKNSSSGGRSLNNLFGLTHAGGNNIAYPSVWASAQDWEQNWGPYLTNRPQTIQAYAADLTINPRHRYNDNPAYPGELAARYTQLLTATNSCGTTF